MYTSLAITVMGKNQPGIISSLSMAGARHGANWLDSHLAEMAGQFAGIVHLEVPPENIDGLCAELSELEQSGLKLTVVVSSPDTPAAKGRLLALELVGQDHPGIVRDISELLAANNINIEELETECVSGSMSGGLIFKASATMSVPEAISDEELDVLLQQVSSGLMVDIVLEQGES